MNSIAMLSVALESEVEVNTTNERLIHAFVNSEFGYPLVMSKDPVFVALSMELFGEPVTEVYPGTAQNLADMLAAKLPDGEERMAFVA